MRLAHYQSLWVHTQVQDGLPNGLQGCTGYEYVPLCLYTLPCMQGLSDRGSTKTGFYNLAFMFFNIITLVPLRSRSPRGEPRRRQTCGSGQTPPLRRQTPILRDRVNQRESKLLLLLARRLSTLPCYVLRSQAHCPPFFWRSAGPVCNGFVVFGVLNPKAVSFATILLMHNNRSCFFCWYGVLRSFLLTF